MEPSQVCQLWQQQPSISLPSPAPYFSEQNSNYCGQKIWRFGPSIARPTVSPQELSSFQFFLDGDLSYDFRPLGNFPLGQHQRFFIHTPLQMNLAKTSKNDSPLLTRMLREVAGRPAACVLHIGTQGTIHTVAERINRLNVPLTSLPSQCSLLLEPPAGEGQKLGADWDELRRLFELIDRSKNIGLCLDTQHMYGAGMCQFSSPEEVNYILEGASTIAPIGLIHLNDSEVPYRSHKDKHAHIGQGYIWGQNQASLQQLLYRCHIADVDVVTETHGNHFVERQICRALLENSLALPVKG